MLPPSYIPSSCYFFISKKCFVVLLDNLEEELLIGIWNIEPIFLSMHETVTNSVAAQVSTEKDIYYHNHITFNHWFSQHVT
jgi:hypothetical protein